MLAVIAAGIRVMVSGESCSACWSRWAAWCGRIMSREVAETVAARNRWAHEVICLTCLRRWVP